MAYVDEQTKRINDLYATLKNQQIGSATSQNDQAIASLRKQLADQLPQYQTQRAQADVSQVQNMNKLKEYMANSGAYNSGDNFSRASNLLTQRSNLVNQTNANENTFTTGMNTKIADTNNQYQNTVNNINSNLDAQKARDINALMEQVRQQEVAQQEAQAQRDFQAKQAEIAYQHQLAATQASRSSSSGSKSSSSQSKQNSQNGIESELYKQADRGTADQFLASNRDAIIENYGSEYYQKLVKMANDAKRNSSQAAAYTRADNIYNKNSKAY